MKIVLDMEEAMWIVRKALPDVVPQGFHITDVTGKGYPTREVEISIEKNVEPNDKRA